MLEPTREPAKTFGQPARRPRHQDVATLAGQHLIDYGLRNRLRMQQRVHPAVFGGEAADERGAGEALGDEDGAHAGGVVARHQLGGQSLVEGDGGGLGGRVIDHVGGGGVAGLGGDGDDHAVVATQHGGQKLAGQPVVREGVDLELEAGLGLGAAEDGHAAAQAGVVDQHGGLAHGGADLGRGLSDGRRRGDIALVVAYRRWQLILRRLDVQNGHLDATATQQRRDLASDAVAPARQHDDLPVPVVAVGDAVVQGTTVHRSIDAPEHGQRGEDLDGLQKSGVLLGDISALGCVVGEEEQRDGLPGAEDGALEEFAEYISSEPCAMCD